MAMAMVQLLLLLLLVILGYAQALFFRADYSLRQPYIGADLNIPNWDYGGSAVISSNYIRLTPDHQSKAGHVWSRIPVEFPSWEVIVDFNVHGNGKSLFGDGFAFWYTKEPLVSGDVFGSKNLFEGLGVFFDTYSNHNGQHKHDHPYVSAMVGDGDTLYDHDSDGTHSEIAGCTSYFRNRDHSTQAKISYDGNVLEVSIATEAPGAYQKCFRSEDVYLDTGYYFGVSAATGDVADNHDIVSIYVYDMQASAPRRPTEVNEQLKTVPQFFKPHAVHAEKPREHTPDNKVSNIITYITITFFGTLFLILLLFGISVVVRMKMRDNANKRF